jgi:hypothetical protein
MNLLKVQKTEREKKIDGFGSFGQQIGQNAYFRQISTMPPLITAKTLVVPGKNEAHLHHTNTHRNITSDGNHSTGRQSQRRTNPDASPRKTTKKAKKKKSQKKRESLKEKNISPSSHSPDVVSDEKKPGLLNRAIRADQDIQKQQREAQIVALTSHSIQLSRKIKLNQENIDNFEDPKDIRELENY